jgi:hypothetical protein
VENLNLEVNLEEELKAKVVLTADPNHAQKDKYIVKDILDIVEAKPLEFLEVVLLLRVKLVLKDLFKIKPILPKDIDFKLVLQN